MKRFKLFLLTICASALCLFFNSCDDNSVSKDEYYIVLDNVSTNLADDHGNLLTQEIFDKFKFTNDKKNVSLGMYSEIPYEVFREQCNNLSISLKQAWTDKVPAGGYIDYFFSLRVNNPDGASYDSSLISVRN